MRWNKMNKAELPSKDNLSKDYEDQVYREAMLRLLERIASALERIPNVR